MSRGIWRRSLKFSRSLTHFMSLVSFSAPRMHEKTSGFVYECCEIFIFGTDFLFLVLGQFCLVQKYLVCQGICFFASVRLCDLPVVVSATHSSSFFLRNGSLGLFFCLLVFCKLIDKFPRLINGKRGCQTVNKFLQRFR